MLDQIDNNVIDARRLIDWRPVISTVCVSWFAGRAAFIGMGFADRGDSFDLLVSIQDHFKYVLYLPP